VKATGVKAANGSRVLVIESTANARVESGWLNSTGLGVCAELLRRTGDLGPNTVIRINKRIKQTNALIRIERMNSGLVLRNGTVVLPEPSAQFITILVAMKFFSLNHATRFTHSKKSLTLLLACHIFA
jgi:hypothetical protein